MSDLRDLTDSLPLLVALVDRDLRYRFNNRPYEEWFGYKPEELLGRTLPDVLGAPAVDAVRHHIDRVLGGEAVSFDQFMPYARGGARHIHVDYVPRRDADGGVDGFYAVVQDVTDRKRTDLRREALVALTDALATSSDPAELARAGSGALGRHLSVGRVGYATINAVAETLEVERDWTAPGVASIAGTIRLRDYGDFIDDLKAGRLLAVEDVRGDPRVAHAVADLEAAACRAFINVPILEAGELVAMLFVNHPDARPWSDDDLALTQEFAVRIRDAAERARAVRALRQNETRLRFLDDLAQAVQPLTDADAILAVTTRMTAQHLGVPSCAYADMEEDQDHFFIRGDWAAEGRASIVGHYALGDFGQKAVRELGVGRPLVVHDNLAELPAHEAATFQAIGIAATICMPLVKDGRLTALMAVHDDRPHRWTDDELSLVREVTERSWAHVERVGAEAALRQSEERYRTLFNVIDEGFCVIEFIDGPHGPLSDYVHVEANPAYTVNAGIEDIVGKRLREIVGDEAEEWLALYQGVLETGRPIRFEKELEATGRWLELAAFRVQDADRPQVAVLFKDVTAKRRAELALHELNATLEGRVAAALADKKLFADIIQSADAFVQVVDLEGRWLAINDASAAEFERIFGVPPVVGMKMSDALAHLPDQAAAVEAIWARAMREAPFIDVQEFGDPDRDRRFYEMRYYPLLDAEGAKVGAYQIVYDVTERLAEQKRLKDAEEALRQSQKMEAVGQLTGGIAHDFNNLLAGIIGSLELLGKRLGEGRLNGMERYIDAAQGAAQRAASLTQRLLAFSRRQTLDPKPTDVNRLIGGMEELIRRSVGPNVEVEVVGAGGLWATRIDQPQLENALLNLCINARDAMAPDGGRLTIETANKWLDDRHARERDLPPGQYVSLCVTDTGSGMTPEVQAQAFDPFFTTKPLGQGTGLGLSMIHGFVRQSGGQVRIYSEVGKGTTMCLYLPRWLGGMEADEAPASAAGPDAGHGETVLVIDDEPTVRMLVAEVLIEAGYRVLEAADGPSGLDILRGEARIDLLISDVGLPGGMNGRQVADAARVVRPDLKVLFMTGYAENAAVGNGMLAPGMEVLTKPFVMADLAHKVREMIDAA